MHKEQQKVRHIREQLLSDNWYTLKKYTFELLRRDGRWQEQSREAYDRGNGAVILLYNKAKQTVVLTRQFRLPVYINGHSGFLIEAAAGLLDNASPEKRIIAEAEEETGLKVTAVEKVFEAYMSPGSVTEKLFFFIAEYAEYNRSGAGGGLADIHGLGSFRNRHGCRSRPGGAGCLGDQLFFRCRRRVPDFLLLIAGAECQRQ